MAFKLRERGRARKSNKIQKHVMLTSSNGGTLIFGIGFLDDRPEADMDYVRVYVEDDGSGQMALEFSAEPGKGFLKLVKSGSTAKVRVEYPVRDAGIVLRPDNLVQGVGEWCDLDLGEGLTPLLVCSFPAETNGIKLIPAEGDETPPIDPEKVRRGRRKAEETASE